MFMAVIFDKDGLVHGVMEEVDFDQWVARHQLFVAEGTNGCGRLNRNGIWAYSYSLGNLMLK